MSAKCHERTVVVPSPCNPKGALALFTFDANRSAEQIGRREFKRELEALDVSSRWSCWTLGWKMTGERLLSFRRFDTATMRGAFACVVVFGCVRPIREAMKRYESGYR